MCMRSLFPYLFSCFCGLSSLAAQSRIVINELFSTGESPTLRAEFVELHNAGTSAQDLSGWRLQRGIDFEFPKGSVLQAGEYAVVAQNTRDLSRKFALASNAKIWGNYRGRLKSGGECVELADTAGNIIDKVEYELGFPYPTVSESRGTSLQLMHPLLPNNEAAHWRSAMPSPAAANIAVLLPTANAAPRIDKVSHIPQEPKSGETVLIRARIQDAEGVQRADVLYQLVPAGAYIRLKDAAYNNARNWIAVAMNDEGRDGDEQAADGIFSARLPASLQKHRQLIRYRISAQDRTSESVTVPYSDDPQPNFAYFCFDQPAPYLHKYSFKDLYPLPICHLLARQEDVEYNINQYRGDSYKNTGTVVYNGTVYDHIGFRSRGYNNRHARKKRNLKFNFNRAHHAKTLDNYGNPYPVKRGKWVLSGTWLLGKPNTHGIAECLTYRLFNLQGAPATQTDFLHLRVITQPIENDTIGNDFWGIYLLMENFDKDFLQTHAMPNGNIYAYKPPKLRNQHPDSSLFGLSNSPYLEWDKNCELPNTEAWWRAHLDLPAYFGFLATQEIIANRETGYRKQHWWMEYHNPKVNNWIIFPWDMDATWTQTTGNSTISGAMRKAAFSHPAIQIEYINHLRGVLDLLFTSEQMGMMMDEYARFIYNPAKPQSMVDLDKMRWGHHYKSFGEELQKLRRFVEARRQYLLSKLPTECPPTPSLRYTGANGFPADELRFVCSEYKDSSPFAAMQWHLAEISPSNAPADRPRLYEYTPAWQSGEISSFNASLALPKGAARPNALYRLRVRFKNRLGYYSHWSAPVEFSAGAPTQNIIGKIAFSEVLYDVEDKKTQSEFIELRNVSKSEVQLQGCFVGGAVDFRFMQPLVLAPDSMLILVADSVLFRSQYPSLSIAGSYKGKIKKEGETLYLYDVFGQLVDSLSLPESKKKGHSYEANDLLFRPLASSWQWSPAGGTPLRAAADLNPPPPPPPLPPKPTARDLALLSWKEILRQAKAAVFANLPNEKRET